MDGVLREIAVFLRQLGAGPGADPAAAVPRFVIPAVFWAALAVVALQRFRRVRASRDLLLGAAALAGLLRELLMLVLEYGSHRGLLSFASAVPFYPPLEHYLELAVQVVAAYALLSSLRGPGRLVRGYLWTGLGAATLAYLVVAPAWAGESCSKRSSVAPSRLGWAEPSGSPTWSTAATLQSSTSGCRSRRRIISAPP